MQLRSRTGDVLVAATCALTGVGLFALELQPGLSAFWLVVDACAGFVGCVSLLWRRQQPVAVAAIMVPIAVVSFTSSLAMLVALFGLAGRRGPVAALVASCLDLAAVMIGAATNAHRDGPLWQIAVWVAVALAATVAVALYTQARRDLIASLKERAERLEQEKVREAERARSAERARLAQEMHDVIAHRLSLISLHSGVLQVDRAAREHKSVADGALFLQTTAQTALRELRDVIGVLRNDDDGVRAAPTAPQPTLVDVPLLVDQARTAGLRIEYRGVLDDAALARAPAGIGRHVHRVVQEGLTNLAKHAPTSAARITLDVPAEGGLLVTMSNDLPRTHDGANGGSGLVSLHERVTRAGGYFDSGVEGARFVLRARWSAR